MFIKITMPFPRKWESILNSIDFLSNYSGFGNDNKKLIFSPFLNLERVKSKIINEKSHKKLFKR